MRGINFLHNMRNFHTPIAISLITSYCIRNTAEVLAQSQCASFAPPAQVFGKKFFNSVTGEYIPVKGINYYPRPNAGELSRTNSIDFFTDAYRFLWEPDIIRFQQLNVNVVRIYAVQPGVSHDAFMCALRAAGIYLIVGLAADCENCAVTQEAPPDCYHPELKMRGQFIIAEFARYDNVLAFSAGNEISLNAVAPLVNTPCQKQFIRDMRAYVRRCDATIRPIPVGLDIADVDREEQALWFSCRSDPEDDLENAEFIGINVYLHCDGTVSDPDGLIGFEALLADFQTYEISVPVVLSEYGCISPSFPTIDGFAAQRNFLQVDTLFSERYREEFVGGVVFEYSTELINSLSPYPFTMFGEGQYGIGYLEPEDCDDITINCTYVPFPQYTTLSAKYSAVDTSSEQNKIDYEASFTSLSTPECPTTFARLDSYDWSSSAAVEDLECPGPVFVQCDAIPIECTNLGMPLPAPVSPSPSMTATTSETASPMLALEPTPTPSVSIMPNLDLAESSNPTQSIMETMKPTRVPFNDTKAPEAQASAAPTSQTTKNSETTFAPTRPTSGSSETTLFFIAWMTFLLILV